MQIIRDHRHITDNVQGSAIAIGNFDGLHQGHKAVIGSMLDWANTHKTPKAIMTFEPHPRRFFHPENEIFRLMPFHQKMRIFQQMGIDTVFAFRFNQCFSSLNAQEFIDEVLVKNMAVRHVVTGQDFIFGAKRSGNASTLYDASHHHQHFTYEAISPQGEEGMTYSSSRIRQLIETGHMEDAAEILGRPYQWMGQVIHGDKRGSTIGFPTANIVPPPTLMPALGVYAVRVQLPDTQGFVDGVANLGVRPTFGEDKLLLEVHLFDQDIDLYGKRLKVDFIAHIRAEQKMEGLDALKNQITQDCIQAREILKNSAEN